MIKSDNKILYFPIKIALGFLIFTEILFFVGPIDFMGESYLLLFLYLALLNISLWRGYKMGLRNFKPSRFKMNMLTIKMILFFGLLLSIVQLRSMWGAHGLSLSFNTLVRGILNPSDNYFSEGITTIERSGLLYLILTPIMWAALPLGIYKWAKLDSIGKILTICVIIVQIIAWLGIGTRKGLFDIILIVIFISVVSNNRILLEKDLHKRFKRGALFGCVVFIFYFVYSTLSRYGLGLSEIGDFEVSLKLRKFYEEYIPVWLIFPLFSITSYLCQGYYALSLSLSMGILKPAVLGSSWFTMVIARKFGYDPLPDTYMAALEPMGLDPGMNWHSIYVWLANDVTFIGVPILIYLIGYFYSTTWADCIYGKNDTAIPIFALFLIMVFYFYANNQVLSFSFMPFVVWFLIYLITRMKY